MCMYIHISETLLIWGSDSCDNTGNEVIRRDGASLFPHAGRTLGQANLYKARRFLTDEKHVVVMYEPRSSPGSLDSKLGTRTYLAHEGRFVTIDKAI